MEDAKLKLGKNPGVCSFASLVSKKEILGAKRKLIQSKLSFGNRVVRGKIRLVSPSTNRKRWIMEDRGEAI